MKIILLCLMLSPFTYAKERTPLFFSNSLTSTENTITYWLEGISLTYQHNFNNGRIAVLKLSGESKTCTITAYDTESSSAVENIYKELTSESIKMRTIHCLTASNLTNGVVTLNATADQETSVKIITKL